MEDRQKATWIPELDILRGFAILGILILHTAACCFNRTIVSDLLGLLFFVAYTVSFFGVPLFVLISGLVLMHKYGDTFSIVSFYKKRFQSVVPPYIIFSLFYLLLSAWINSLDAGSWPTIRFGDFLYFLFTGTAYVHLWFLAAIIQLYAAYPLLAKAYAFFKQRNQLEVLLVSLFVLQTTWNMLFFESSFLGSVSVLFYFILGFYCADNYQRVRGWVGNASFLTQGVLWLILTISVTAFMLDARFPDSSVYPYVIPSVAYVILLRPFLVLLTFSLLFKIALRYGEKESPLKKTVYSLGLYSFGIYLVHVFFHTILMRAFAGYGITSDSWQLLFPLIFLGMLTLSYLTVRAIEVLPLSWLLFGLRQTTPTETIKNTTSENHSR